VVLEIFHRRLCRERFHHNAAVHDIADFLHAQLLYHKTAPGQHFHQAFRHQTVHGLFYGGRAYGKAFCNLVDYHLFTGFQFTGHNLVSDLVVCPFQ
jgi:hypothetical protein